MAKILLIEDEEDIRLNISEMLALAKHDVLAARDGREGIAMALAHTPDLILSDVNMPGMDGFGVLHILRNDPSTKEIPFIFLTSKSETSDFRQAMTLGADDYITKPFEGSDLFNTIESRLKKAKKQPEASNSQIVSENTDDAVLPMSVDNDPLNTLIANCDVLDLKKKHILYKEGSTARFLYFVKSGKVKTYKSHEHGRDLVLGLFGEGDYLGYAPILEGISQVETAEVIEDSEIVLIPRARFETLVNDHAKVMKKFLGLLAKNLVEKEAQLLGATYNPLRKKVAEALVTIERKYRLQKDGNYQINMSRDELASIAGTATESLIRTLTEFKKEKLIDMDKGAITIINPNRLQNLLR